MRDERSASGVERGEARPSTDSTAADAERSPVHPRLSVVVDDLAFFAGDGIARPVTAELAATTPLGRRLERAALEGERGARLAGQLRPSEPLAVGSAVVTGAGALGVELLVHAVVQSATERVTREGVGRATASALQRAEAFGVRHLGLPPFGLGAGNLDVDQAAEAMLEPMLHHLSRAERPVRLTVIVETEDEQRAFAARLPQRGER